MYRETYADGYVDNHDGSRESYTWDAREVAYYSNGNEPPPARERGDYRYAGHEGYRDPYRRPPAVQDRTNSYKSGTLDGQDRYTSSYKVSASDDAPDRYRSSYSGPPLSIVVDESDDLRSGGGSYRAPPSSGDDSYCENSLQRATSIPPGYVRYGSVLLAPSLLSEVSKSKRREKPLRCDTVFVGSLPNNTEERHLRDIFADCGRIIDVRVSWGRNFGHVQFSNEDAVDKAIAFSGSHVRIGPSAADESKIFVDYAHPKGGDTSGESSMQATSDGQEQLTFNTQNAGIVSSDLHSASRFPAAARNLARWLERGHCTPATSNTFFGLMSAVNVCSKKVSKDMKAIKDEMEEAVQKKRAKMEALKTESRIIEEVFAAAAHQKSWDHFTKPQRKSISQWKEHAMEIAKDVASHVYGESAQNKDLELDEPSTKKAKSDSNVAAELATAKMEMELLRAQGEKKDKQILQLKTLLARFKETCPQEWEKALGLKLLPKTNDKKAEVKPDMINGVDLADLAFAMSSEGESALAAAAASYAKMRAALGTTEPSLHGLDITKADIAIVTVLASYLTVHPLGATLEEMTQYFKSFNPNSSGPYLESLLRRLPQVFQPSQTTDGQTKWWFLGFQTCCCQAAQQGGGDLAQGVGVNGHVTPINSSSCGNAITSVTNSKR